MKKLFSYLLISSMVVLSSCTNYDDQFDDLNTQINSLKGQIEGFSSLSSGLTALQGTVASLQTAIANIPVTPATDVSGLATAANLTALDTALTALAAEVTALTTALANAATSAEVSALAASLATAQADLAEILASNNVYTPVGAVLTIGSVSQLTFAESLGDKLSIINGSIKVTHTDQMDATKLAAVLAKVGTVTGDVTYTAIAAGITPTAGFTVLAAASDMTINANGAISFPELTTAARVILTSNSKTTSVSLPKLVSVTDLGGATAGDDVLAFSKATSFDMGALVRYDATTLSITTLSGLTNLDALQIMSAATVPAEEITKLTINGATEISIDALTKGEIDANKVALVDFPVWQGHTDSQFAKASKVVLASITGNVAVDLDTFAPKATYFHMIGAEFNPPTNAAANSAFATFDAGTSNSSLETLILEGVIKTVTVNGASDLTSYTHTGNTHDVDFINNDSMTSVTFGHTSTLNSGAKGVARTYGSLEVSGNLEITSVTATLLDDISKLDINTNAALETLSFPLLNSLGTDTDGTALVAGQADVNITGNNLTASSIQLPTGTDVLPAVAGKITTASGLKDISTWIGLASALDAAEYVRLDKVTSVLTSTGTAHTGAFRLGLATAQKTQSWATEGDPVVIVDAAVTGALLTKQVDAVNQKSTYKLGGTVDTSDTAGTFAFVPATGETAASVVMNSTWYNAITGFAASDVNTWAEALGTALQAKLTENNASYTVTVAKDFGESARYVIRTIDGDGTLSTTTGANAASTITFTLDSKTITAAVATADNDGLMNAIEDAINASALSATWKAASNSNIELAITRQLAVGSDDANYAGAYPDFNFAASVYTKANSLVAFLPASATISQRSKVESANWRITMENTNQAFNAALLDLPGDASQASFITSSGVTITELLDATDFVAVSETGLQVDYGNIVEFAAATYDSSSLKIDLRTWF